MSNNRVTEWIKEKGSPVGTLLLAAVIVGASIGSAARAHADPISDAYAAKYAPVVCQVLDKYPTFSGINGVAEGIHKDGLTYYEAGSVIATAVIYTCPGYLPLLDAWVKAVRSQPTETFRA